MIKQWIKWHKKYNSGPGRDEYFLYEGDLTELGITDYICDMYIDIRTESENYRGIGYELVNLPPHDWLMEEITKYHNTIQSSKQYMNKLYSYIHYYVVADDDF